MPKPRLGSRLDRASYRAGPDVTVEGCGMDAAEQGADCSAVQESKSDCMLRLQLRDCGWMLIFHTTSNVSLGHRSHRLRRHCPKCPVMALTL